MPNYFLDTYALIEITKKSQNYAKYASIKYSVTSKLNLMELYYTILRDYGKETAEKEYSLFWPIKINYSEETMKNSMELRAKLRKEKKLKLSYADAIGYQIAIENGFKFVTGDKAFETLECAEYVK